MRILFLCVLLIAGCRNKEEDVSLLGKWQIIRLKGNDSLGRDLYIYNSRRDTTKRYVAFINDTTFVDSARSRPVDKKAVDTVRYLLVGDSIFSRRGIKNYSLQVLTNDSLLITGDDHSSITIVRVDRKP